MLSILPLKILVGPLEAYPEPARLTRCHFWVSQFPVSPFLALTHLFVSPSSAMTPLPRCPTQALSPLPVPSPPTLSLLPMPTILPWPFCLCTLIPRWPLCLGLLIPALYIVSCHCLVTGLSPLWSESCIRSGPRTVLVTPVVLSITQHRLAKVEGSVKTGWMTVKFVEWLRSLVGGGDTMGGRIFWEGT